jgi:hypothetical protein
MIRPNGSGGFRTGTNNVFTLIPDAQSTNPGIFGELVLPVSCQLEVKAGARVD